MFEHLLDRQESALKKDKAFFLSIVPQQPGESLVGICHFEYEHFCKMKKQKTRLMYNCAHLRSKDKGKYDI